MADHINTGPRPSLFARKGEAEPAPAVAYVSLRQMQGKPERREEGPDRRAQWSAQQRDEGAPDSQAPQRRGFAASGPDHDGRRHFTPRSGLAMDQEYVPWKAPEDKAEAPQKSVAARRASSPSVSALSALIHRHQDGLAKPASVVPEPTPLPTPAQAQAAAGPTKIDMSYLSAAGAGGGRGAARKPSPAAPEAPQAAKPPTAYKPKKLRKKVTVRLEIDHFKQIKELAERTGKSRQSVMAKAVANYLSKID